MLFNYEHQMLEPADNWLVSQGLVTKKEFSTPWGVCDLVGCCLEEENIIKRLSLKQTKSIGPQIRVMILSRIPDSEKGKSITPQQLYQEFAGFFNEDRIDFEVKRLLKNKFIQETPQGNIQKLNGWMPLQKKIVALELKLTRISEALSQAINNLEFADESYVGLPIDRAKNLLQKKKNFDFVEYGIGILGVDPQDCKVILKPNPTKSDKNPVIQAHCVERFWRSRPTLKAI